VSMIGGKLLKLYFARPIDIFFAEAPNRLHGFLAFGILFGAVSTNEEVLGTSLPNRFPNFLKGIQTVIHKEQKRCLKHATKVG